MQKLIYDEMVVKEENISSERLIKKSFLTLLCINSLIWILLFVFFIALINPYGVSFLNIGLKNINHYKPKRSNIDRLIKPYEVWKYQPKTIFVGTSRVQQSLNPNVLNQTKYAPAYNAAIPASSMEENYFNIENFIKLDKNLKDVVLELYVYNFTIGIKNLDFKSKLDLLKNILALQFSMSAIKDAIATVNYNHNQLENPDHIAALGYRKYPKTFNPLNTFDVITNLKYVLTQHNANKLAINDENFKYLEKIIKLCKKHGITLHLWILPNYPWDKFRIQALGSSGDYNRWLEHISRYPNVTDFDQMNELSAEKLSNNIQYWNDPIHISLKMGSIFLKEYFKNEKENHMHFIKLNKDNVENVIINENKKLELWKQNNTDYTNTFAEIKNELFEPSYINQTLNLNIDNNYIQYGNARYNIVPGYGEILFSQSSEDGLDFNGWAFDLEHHDKVKKLIAVLNNKVIGEAFPSVVNQPLNDAIGGPKIYTGFAIHVKNNDLDKANKITIFALTKYGTAFQLTTQDVHIKQERLFKQLGNYDDHSLIIHGKHYKIINQKSIQIDSLIHLTQGIYCNGKIINVKKLDNIEGLVIGSKSRILNRGFIYYHGPKQYNFEITIPLKQDTGIDLFIYEKNGTAYKLKI